MSKVITAAQAALLIGPGTRLHYRPNGIEHPSNPGKDPVTVIDKSTPEDVDTCKRVLTRELSQARATREDVRPIVAALARLESLHAAR